MAKTTNLGLNLTEDENTSFSDWRRSIDGNGSGESKSNFQKIDEAIGALGSGAFVIEYSDGMWGDISEMTGTAYGSFHITEEQKNQIINNFSNTILRINGVHLYPLSVNTGETGEQVYKYYNTYVVSNSMIIRLEAWGTDFGHDYSLGELSYEVIAINSEDDDFELNRSVVVDRNNTFYEWMAISNVYHDIRIWYKYGEPNGDSIDLEPEVLITNLSVDIRDGVSGFSVFGLIAGAPLYGGKLRAVGVFLDPNAETVTHFDKEL